MAGDAADRIAGLLKAGQGSPVVDEFATILCKRWLSEAQAARARGAADARLIDALESLIDWASQKGLLADGCDDGAETLDLVKV